MELTLVRMINIGEGYNMVRRISVESADRVFQKKKKKRKKNKGKAEREIQQIVQLVGEEEQ